MNDETNLDELTPAEPPTEEEIRQKIRESRGAQLRALIISWYTGDTYQRALQEQAEALREEGLVINDDWGDMAEHILEQYAQAAAPTGVVGLDGEEV